MFHSTNQKQLCILTSSCINQMRSIRMLPRRLFCSNGPLSRSEAAQFLPVGVRYLHRERQFSFVSIHSSLTLVRYASISLPSSSSLFYSTSTPQQRRSQPINPKLASRDRGPASKEDTQTDFAALNVLGNSTNATTAIEVCSTDGFTLDNGLLIGDGDGLMLVGSEVFVWRPWMNHNDADQKVVITGEMLRKAARKSIGATEMEKTAGVLNNKGQFDVNKYVWGVLEMVWPKPDLIIVGTGPTIRPLSPQTRNDLQDMGLRIEVLDTRNAASQYNLLSTERGGNEVAAAMVPIGFGQ